MSILGLDITSGSIVIGAVTGLAYGLLAMGLILVYRATRIINFAYGEIGAFCALVFARLVVDDGWAYVPALGIVIALGLAVGAFWERVVVQPLFDRPRIVLLIATVGISQVMAAAQSVVGGVDHPAAFPQIVSLRWQVAGTVLTGADVALSVLVPAISLGLALLWRTSLGLAIRATAENGDAARLAGIRVRRVSMATFAISGGLAALTFVLVDPVRSGSANALTTAIGPSLLVRALIAALIGRFWSMPLAMVGGVALGILEAVVSHNAADPGLIEIVLLGVLLILVLGRGAAREGREGSWTLAPAIAPLPRELLRHTGTRLASWAPFVPVVLFAVLAPLLLSGASNQFTLAQLAIFAIAGLSVVLVTGWAGQLSLAQFAFVGLGAMATARLTARGMSFPEAVVVSSAIGAVIATGLGLPASRTAGVQLAMVTLAFSVAASDWLFPSSLLADGESEVSVARPTVFGVDLTNQRSYALACTAAFAALAVLVACVRHFGFGRQMIAVRDNEPAAEATTIWPTSVKVMSFALGGAIAGFAGALYAGLLQGFGPSNFDPTMSLTLLTAVVVGGVASVWGSYLGALFVVGGAAWLNPVFSSLLPDQDALTALLGGAGLCSVLILQPAGMVGRLQQDRARLVAALTRRRAPAATSAGDPDPTAAIPAIAHDPTVMTRGSLALEVVGLTVEFAGIRANDEISIDVAAGEIVGLLGTNGAGKSTLMDAVSGFVRVTGGQVRIFGQDATALPPYRRAELGVARVFQDARLFPGLTVHETLMLAQEPVARTSLADALLMPPQALMREDHQRRRGERLAAAVGLSEHLDRLVGELSIGTRRVLEIACATASAPRLLLLDEPTAGIAQRDAEAFGPMLRGIRDELGVAILIIEHDVPLITSLCDRVYALASGAVIAQGDPQSVRDDPHVVAAYLGLDDRAVQRSSAAVLVPSPQEESP